MSCVLGIGLRVPSFACQGIELGMGCKGLVPARNLGVSEVFVVQSISPAHINRSSPMPGKQHSRAKRQL